MRLNSRKVRSGQILALVALLLPALLGMVGLMLDSGLLLSAHRKTQLAADAGALAAARHVLSGGTLSEAGAVAESLIQSHTGLSDATVLVQSPPKQGSFANNVDFVEVTVSLQSPTWLIQVVGAASSQTVASRSVAGVKRLADPHAVCLLSDAATPGLRVAKGGLVVQGKVGVNSPGAGLDAQGAFVDLGQPGSAVVLDGDLQARSVDVVGGVDAPARVLPLDGESEPPLRAGVLPRADGLRLLATPTTATGVLARFPDGQGLLASAPQDVVLEIGEDDLTLEPGIYASIMITGAGAGSVTFKPGIYVLAGGDDAGRALHIETSAAITAQGVLFHNSASGYNAETGHVASNPKTGAILLAAPDLKLTSLNDPGSLFHGLLLDQRRGNVRPITLKQVALTTTIDGTIYARDAPCLLSGTGALSTQLLVGTLTVENPDGALLIQTPNRAARSPLIYLVE